MYNYGSLLLPIKAAMLETGLFQLAEWRKRSAGWAQEKAAKDLVSFVDIESEKRLSAALKALLPDASFYGEEGEKSRGELTWVVDPVDGTTNYVSGLDYFCISVALFSGLGAGSKPEIGVVHRPTTGEWYWAIRGCGAWEESRGEVRRLPGAEGIELRRSLVCTGTPYRSPDTVEAFYATAREVTAAALDLRRLGSAALDLCMVAAGRLQAFWEVDLKPYDVGAALLLLEETRCAISTIGGSRYDPFASRSLVSGSPGAADELRAIAARHYAGIATA
jgi:Archaeal fructose-1,6-bisphosphatase and related enzymes of inositol monophosphatase family